MYELEIACNLWKTCQVFFFFFFVHSSANYSWSMTQPSSWLPEIRCPQIRWGLDPNIFRDSWLQKAFSFPLKWGLPPEIGVSHVGSTQLGRKWLAVQWGTSLVAQWLRLHHPNAECPGSIPDQGTKVPCATTKNLHAWTKMGDPTCCN